MQLFPAPEQTIEFTAHAIRNGEISCVAVLERCLAQIDELETDIRAWVSVDREGALQQARSLDEDLRSGLWRGDLHGIPIGIKDIVDVAGQVTGAGSSWFAQQPPANFDAEIVRRLRDAGAIILGKTVTTQFACFDPPVTRNPWNLERTPGGSSSGSVAAVASGMCFGAIGSQTGGSLTRPASFCGVATCKPSFGAVPLEGIVPLAPSMDHPGPIARTVRDTAILLAVISGDTCGCLSVLAQSPSEPPRIGRLRGFFESQVEASYQTLLDATLERFAAAGAIVFDVPAPVNFEDVIAQHRMIMTTEAAAFHQSHFERHRADYGPCIASLVEQGLAAKAVDYLSAQAHQQTLRSLLLGVMQDVDVLVTPATTGSAPDTATTGDPRMNAPWSFSGFPTVSFPIGLAADGMPLAIQCTGRPFAETQLFGAALWCEAVVRQ